MSLEDRRALVKREECSPVSVRRQCELLNLSRSGLYYEPLPISAENQAIMNKIDEIYLKYPFYGARRMSRELKGLGFYVGRKRTGSLMNLMGLEAVFPGKNTSKPNPQHRVYPYLLRNVEVSRANQVWSTDITYIRLKHGFVYLVAVIDWKSRYVLSWKLSNTLTSDFCIEALKEALSYGTPEIFNTDQGSQFTSAEFTQELKNRGIQISMDGRGRALDNIFVERLWRSVKYENIYLNCYETIPQTQAGLKEYFEFHNVKRRHQSLDYKTPWLIYSGLEVAQNPNPVM